MKKVVKINESDISKMVTEVISELGYNRLNNAANTANSLDGDMILDAINKIKEGLKIYNHTSQQQNGQYGDVVNAVNTIEQFFNRKLRQQDNLQNAVDDINTQADNEFNSAVKSKYPEAYRNDSVFPVDHKKLSDDNYNEIVNNLSPRAQEVGKLRGF